MMRGLFSSMLTQGLTDRDGLALDVLVGGGGGYVDVGVGLLEGG